MHVTFGFYFNKERNDQQLKETRLRLLHLHYANIGRRFILRLLQKDPSLTYIYSQVDKLQAYYSIHYKYASLLQKRLQNAQSYKMFKQTILQYETITILDPSYPTILKQIQDPPIVLYTLGNTQLLHRQPLLSVIGSRHPTHQGRKKVAHIVPPLVKNNWVIVSGMARGIDRYSHELTIQSHGQTIAVLGSGFNHIYPREHKELFREISNKGLVLSEYPPHTAPHPSHFPERNRLISGLSFGTLVIEAKKRSGTMITVDQALDQGREVYAIPGCPFDPHTRGCNALIQDGAKLVQQSTDISEDWERFGSMTFSHMTS